MEWRKDVLQCTPNFQNYSFVVFHEAMDAGNHAMTPGQKSPLIYTSSQKAVWLVHARGNFWNTKFDYL